MAETPNPVVPPQVRDNRVPPAGILPKNMQAIVLCSVAAVMVVVIAFFGGKSTKERNTAPTPRSAVVVDPNAERIKEYQARIEEQARKLQLEQAQLLRTQQNLGAAVPHAAALTAESLPNQSIRPGIYGGTSSTRYATSESGFEGETLKREKEKHAYHALFASNVALSYRKGSASPGSERDAPQAGAGRELSTKALALYGSPTLQAGSADLGQADQELGFLPGIPQGGSTRAMRSEDDTRRPMAPSTRGDEPRTEERAGRSRAKEADAAFSQAEGKKYRLFEGTVLETVLTNRLDGDFSGPVNCQLTTNVYSHSGRHLLIPQGTRLLGEVRRVESFGQRRLAVVFHRMIMPDGYSASLDKFQGLNQIGETGLRDLINHHYTQVFGVSLAIGSIAGLGQMNSRSGFDARGVDLYEQGVAANLSQSSLRILDRYLNVLPEMTIREGHRVKVYLSDDLLLPAYQTHHISTDF